MAVIVKADDGQLLCFFNDLSKVKLELELELEFKQNIQTLLCSDVVVF